ncbi:hypothetical protein ANANG_G00157620 [Anguilla anguilla]|uniref:Uncharacterized protein n=1 Tax=Anguilla anguilla TaxID=7936 RepID=A0A9D3RWE0_ANGAN|nr:hypothetical protein ANANG_G00157620 [Anguilla anguilla]
MDMSRGGPADSPGSPSAYFSLPRSYRAPVRQGAQLPASSPAPPSLPQDSPVQRPTRLSLGGQGGEAAPEPPPEPPSSPGEYINIEYRARPSNAPRAPPTEAPPSPSPHRRPLQEDYLSLDTKARAPAFPLSPHGTPSYTRPIACTPALGSSGRAECCEEADGSDSAPQAEPKLVRATPQGRRRHSVWLRMEGVASPSDPDGACGTESRNGLNYIALDLRDTPTPDPPSPSVLAPPENGVYASIDFSRSDHLTTATSKD